MVVFLIGFMGCGKSTIGKKLAHKLAVDFIDFDQLIEQRENRTISTIFATAGEAYFRKLETKMLLELKNDAAVIALGGGTPCFNNNLEIIKQRGTTVYLKMGIPDLYGRLLGGKAKRPLISNLNNDELLLFIKNKVTEREPFYLKASIVFEAKNFSAQKCIELVALIKS